MQFSLRRLFLLTLIVAVGAALFASLPWPLAVVVLVGLNGIAYVWFSFVKKRNVAKMAALTAVLLFAAILFTDFWLSSVHPVVRIAWAPLIAGCVSQVLTIMLWLVSAPPSSPERSPHAPADDACPGSNSPSEK